MLTSRDSLSFLIVASLWLILLNGKNCFCMNLQSYNASLDGGFLPAIATFYGDPDGIPTGGACGYGNDPLNAPYYGLIAAGNDFLYQAGSECGACYQVKCNLPACSGVPISVTIVDQCPGSCNADKVHFDLSGKAFTLLAKNGQAGALRTLGRVNIVYQRVQCNYKTNIIIKMDAGANPFYIAFVVEDVNGDGDLGYVELQSSGSSQWMAMQRSFGATWKINLPGGAKGPFSVRITTVESKRSATAVNVIPANWVPGGYYNSSVNFN